MLSQMEALFSFSLSSQILLRPWFRCNCLHRLRFLLFRGQTNAYLGLETDLVGVK